MVIFSCLCGDPLSVIPLWRENAKKAAFAPVFLAVYFVKLYIYIFGILLFIFGILLYHFYKIPNG